MAIDAVNKTMNRASQVFLGFLLASFVFGIVCAAQQAHGCRLDSWR